MAEALLASAFKNLLSLGQNEIATLFGIKEKTEKLSNTLVLIKAVIEDAEEKQLTNSSIKVWLKQLKDALYVLDDILDECSMQSHKLGGLSSFTPKNIMFRYEVGSRLNKITRRFDQIAEAKDKFLLREGVRERPSEVAEWRQTSSIIDQPQVYGRDADKEKILEFLLSQEQDSDSLSIYPIIGLGGVGKTTLAQLIYNHERVSNLFSIKIWVCVSENFSIKRILSSIIESILREKYDVFHLDVIERKVQELLQSKRFFLVLDDVWKRNQQLEFGLNPDKWRKLKSVLSCGSKGASILVSSHDGDVATIMGTCQAHHLDGLSEDDCWLLFKQYAFGPEREERPELVAIGKEIVKKIGGSPLAAQALGGLLSIKKEENQWLEVKESRLWSLPDEDSILPALRLSYFHLTPTLKQCFAFCAIFPKDTEISKEDLIHLWMTNGFISSRENMEVEDVGNVIWNELYQKSFFQDVVKYDEFGNIYFKMHDLVHDLAQSVTGQECTILEDEVVTDMSRNTHHIGLGSLSLDIGAFKKVESLRTLYRLELCNTRIIGCIPTNFSLRALCASFLELSSLGNLIHLRYLELHGSDFENLRQLVIEHCDSLSLMFPNIQKLSSLRTLTMYIVSSESGHSLAELRDLKLGGKLHIKGLENVESVYEAQVARLMDKKDLKQLWLTWSEHSNSKPDVDQVLEALQPHSNLKTLEITNYKGLQSPRWIKVLTSLVVLTLSGCENCVRLSSLGKLPSLRILQLWNMDIVKYLDDDESYDGAEMTAFPSLEHLSLEGLPNIERLLKVQKGEIFPCLSFLFVRDCAKLVLPCLPSVESLGLFKSINDGSLRSISNFYGLTFLHLCKGEGLTCLPEGMLRNLTSLKMLIIDGLSQLKELPYELLYLNALEHLEIRECDELGSLPDQVWEGLWSLQNMTFFACRGLRSLPETIQHLTSLEHLEFHSCQGLRSLPDGVRHLTSLKDLRIADCPALEERCREGTGEDWDKIAHIPSIILS